MVAFNLSGELDDMKRRHDLVLAEGCTCVMASLNSVGLVVICDGAARGLAARDGRRGRRRRCPHEPGAALRAGVVLSAGGDLRPGLPPGLWLALYGDDFTGSTAAMAAFNEAGVPTVQFFQPPTAEAIQRVPHGRAVGLHGTARSRIPLLSWCSKGG